MEQNKLKFLDLLIESQSLKFGSFQTKSGRTSPYFINTGSIDSGRRLALAAECYAALFKEKCWPNMATQSCVHLYGPAYKGISLAVGLGMTLSHDREFVEKDVHVTFNRKEAKSHGEGGRFVGSPIDASSELVIVEDVLTGGTSIRETLDLLRPTGAKVIAALIGIDRQEKGSSKRSAREEIEKEFGIPIYSILTITEIVDFLVKSPQGGSRLISETTMEAIRRYWLEQGVSPV